MSFRFKTILGLILIQGCMLALLIWISTQVLNRSLQESLHQRASSTSHLLAALSTEAVLAMDIATLEGYADDILSEPSISYVRIKDPQGNPLVAKGDADALHKPFTADLSVHQVDDSTFDFAETITFADTDYGQVELGFDTQKLNSLKADSFAVLLGIAGIAILATAFFTASLSRYLTRQLTSLKDASAELSSGKLDHRIEITGSDELAATAQAFNSMADNLDQLYSDLAQEISINQSVFETSPSAIIMLDKSADVRRFNDAAQTLFGYRQTEVIDQNISTLLASDDCQNQNQGLSQFLPTQQDTGQYGDLLAIHADNSLIPVHVAIRKLQLHGESCFICIVTDISEQKATEDALKAYRDNLEETVKQRTEELIQARDEAEAGARTKASFIANMSHEIRTPMNAIIGFSEVLRDNASLDASARGQIETITHSARALLSIINDILDVSKLESGKFVLENVAFNLPRAMQLSLKTVEQQAAEKNLELSLDISAQLTPHRVGDPARLRQVILNLVGNAIKFTQSGHIQVAIWPGENDEVNFSISDTGIGMDATQLANIFEPFVQADNSTTRLFGGTGLGVTICKQIVEQMGGSITAESEPGQGSVFRFSIALPMASEQEQCLYDDDDFGQEVLFSPRSFNILLAEDIETNAELAILRLQQLGHKVTWVKQGAEAVELFNQQSFDLILMDVMMPVMDGLEATRKIRQLEANQETPITIIALTASVMREDHQRCIEAGMNQIAAKPMEFAQLLRTMEDLVPTGLGQPIISHQIPLQEDTPADLSALEEVANIEAGLSLWQHYDTYLKALHRFAREHHAAANTLRDLLASEPPLSSEAYQLAHTLKGLTGNLQLKQIPELAEKIDALLKANAIQEAQSYLPALDKALAKAVQAIQSQPLEQQQRSSNHWDPDAVQQLLQRLLFALGEFNPDSAEPLLSDLEAYLSQQELENIQNQIEAFDFDQAQQQTRQLARKFEIELE